MNSETKRIMKIVVDVALENDVEKLEVFYEINNKQKSKLIKTKLVNEFINQLEANKLRFLKMREPK